MSNPNPVSKFKPTHSEPLAKDNVAVRLPIKVDEWVRSLPNRTEWLRQAIIEKYQREKASVQEIQ